MNLLETFFERVQWIGSKNRRRHGRRRRVTLLTIQALQDDLSATGTQMWGMSQNVSPLGIGFICESRIIDPYVRITIVEDNCSLIGLIRHGRVFDHASGKYFYGVEYLDDYSCHDRSRC